jgi:hypothetical protein
MLDYKQFDQSGPAAPPVTTPAASGLHIHNVKPHNFSIAPVQDSYRIWKITTGILAALTVTLVILLWMYLSRPPAVSALVQQQDMRLSTFKQLPLAISQIRVNNEDESGHALAEVSHDHFDAASIRFIGFTVTGPNYYFGDQDHVTTLYVTYVSPQGTVSHNPKISPPGFTLSVPVNMNSAHSTWTTGFGWGRKTEGTFGPGLWRIEFFNENKHLIAEKTFLVR